MAGSFELVDASDGGYRIKMLGGGGSLLAVSMSYPSKAAAVRGIEVLREIGGTGLVRDHSCGTESATCEDDQTADARIAVRNRTPPLHSHLSTGWP
ncbi:hypothetical protein IV500_17735 [Paeniglutamicibacter antarcticus]|uniref:DUF1508 domain-containing protein n=1 Tax=Arthrobacter terrae TaxID=2935737 RepID=A0A931CUK4_9MICC|nr:hypothetical protein [Arthrobacter terrae]MBG0741211.1 hypothetical protein [Arthrobacter terrae]